MRIIFLGAPGAGKGTQADIVSAKYGIPAISTGAIIREAIARGTEMGLAARSYTEKGLLVPDDVVISIEVSDEDIVKRMSGRRVCGSCGASYHILYKPSKNGEQCERCGSDLSIRADDKPEVVLDRLNVYHKMTEPLKDYYKKKGKCVEVQGQEILDDTSALVREQIALAFGK